MYTDEYIKNYLKNDNNELIKRYKRNNKNWIEYKCSNGHICNTIFSSYKTGRRCKICQHKINGQKQRHTFEYIYNYFLKNECLLLEKEYVNSHTKMKYKCKCNNISYKTFANFQQGQRCIECSGNKKFTFDFIKKYIESFEYKLLSTEYINNNTKLLIECDKGHMYDVRFVDFYNNETRCLKCFKENNVGKNHPRYNKDRTIKSRNKYLSFNLKNTEILFDDPNYKIYLEEKAKDNKNIYDIDHIFPRMAFIDNNLDLIYGSKIIKEICNSRDNLRIVNNKENKSKAAKYNQEEFINWFNQKLEKYNETSENNIE